MTEKTVTIPVFYLEKIARRAATLAAILPPCDGMRPELRDIAIYLGRIAESVALGEEDRMDHGLEDLAGALCDAITLAKWINEGGIK
jgi:hypothetical protein